MNAVSGQSKRTRGFTLIEMVVVIGVIGMLISILLPTFYKARETSRRTVCVANLKQVGAAIFTYANSYDDKAPVVMPKMGTTAPRTLISRPGKLVNLGSLLQNELSETELLYCPSQKTFNYPTDVQFLTTGNVGCSYAYAVHLPAEDTPRVGSIRHLALVAEDFVARLGAPSGIGMESHKVGYNSLYTDGSAAWYSDPDMSIARRGVHWDDETDDVTYYTLYSSTGEEAVDADQYGDALDIFRVWHSFCYNLTDPFSKDDDDSDADP